MSDCPHCDGTGICQHPYHSGLNIVPDGGESGRTSILEMLFEECPNCGGTNTQQGEECPHCDGTGRDPDSFL